MKNQASEFEKIADFSIKSLGAPQIASPLTQRQSFIDPDDRVLFDLKVKGNKKEASQATDKKLSFEKSGARKKIFFNPRLTKVGIVTCGGLCPGLNAVIRGLVRQLWNRYEVKNIIGIRYGYQGLGNNSAGFIPLSLELVQDIHFVGGSLLGSSRGAPPVVEMVDNLVKNNINILFTIGGDGTMRGAYSIAQEVRRRNLKISIIGIPKTIDNDIPYVMRSFGFETAVEKACDAIMAAYEEARGHYRGVGLVKLMGRSTGFIAAHATISTGVVSLCLVPEVDFDLQGSNSLMDYLESCFQQKGHAVIVVAEGAGQKLFKENQKGERDASGNVILPDIGKLLKEEIGKTFEKQAKPISLKYIDPSYLVRSAPPNCFDRVFCARMAQNAAHAAMSGKTSMLIGYWHGVMTHVPFRTLSGKVKKINPRGTLWFNVMESTTQTVGWEQDTRKHKFYS